MVAEHIVDILTLESDWNIQENHSGEWGCRS